MQDAKDQHTRFALNGKVAVVTGGHRGLGREITIGLATAGADVVVVDKSGPCNSDIPDIVEKLGRRYWSFTADMASPDEIHKVAQAILQTLGSGIDILVNNAGIALLSPLEELSIDAWDRTMAVNLRAPFLLSQAFAGGETGMLAKGKGAIVNVSSVAGKDGLQDHGAYCTSKAALNMLTQVMTVEWAARGIRANAVAPTVIMTDMGRKVWGAPETGGPMLKKIPQGRFVEPFEVADAVVYLASDAASMVNGTVVAVDGGYGCM